MDEDAATNGLLKSFFDFGLIQPEDEDLNALLGRFDGFDQGFNGASMWADLAARARSASRGSNSSPDRDLGAL